MKFRLFSTARKKVSDYLMLQDVSGPAQAQRWKLSALRIILVFGLLLESLIFFRVSWKAAQAGLYDVIGIVIFFFVVLCSTLFLTGRSLKVGSWFLLLTIYAAGACILSAIDIPEIAKLGPIFVYTAPLIALVLFGNRAALLLMALNIIPFIILLRNEKLPNYLHLSTTMDGTHIYIQSLIFLFFNVGIPLAFARVITSLHRATRRSEKINRKLEISLALHEEVFENNGAATLFCQPDSTIVRCNRLAASMLGLRPKQLEGLRLNNLLKQLPDNSDPHKAKPGNDQGEVCEILLSKKQVLQQVTPMSNTGNLLVALHDLSELQQLRTQLNDNRNRANHLARYDGLTNQPNRAHFIEILEGEISQTRSSGKNLAVIHIKIRELRTINERFGISSGDTLINLIGHSLKDNLSENDRLGRTRGGAFSLLLTDLPRTDSEIAERIQHIIHTLPRQHNVSGQAIEIRYFTGVALFPRDAGNALDLIRFSELAQHTASNIQADTPIYFNPGHATAMRRRIDIEVGLRKALREQALMMHYQPKVDSDGQLIGLEALVRWHSTELGLVSPTEFIPVAEEAGLVHDITLQVIRMVSSQIKTWQVLGLSSPPVAINLSAIDLCNPTLVEAVLAQTNQHKLPVALLEFEITETALMINGEAGLHNLNKLKELGFRTSIDDFGSGYSSLAQMAHLPVYAIKIDREFVRHLPGDLRREKIVAGILSLAHSLGLTVIAEGVENAAQLEFLYVRGCRLFQGYHFSRPLPAREIEALLNNLPAMQEITPPQLLVSD